MHIYMHTQVNVYTHCLYSQIYENIYKYITVFLGCVQRWTFISMKHCILSQSDLFRSAHIDPPLKGVGGGGSNEL